MSGGSVQVSPIIQKHHFTLNLVLKRTSIWIGGGGGETENVIYGIWRRSTVIDA